MKQKVKHLITGDKFRHGRDVYMTCQHEDDSNSPMERNAVCIMGDAEGFCEVASELFDPDEYVELVDWSDLFN